jgi:hypothetical protein
MLFNQTLLDLKTLSNVNIWDKAYVSEFDLEVDTYSYFQPVKRMLWNLFYGGADRNKLVNYLEDLYLRVKCNIDICSQSLSKPYVKQNFNNYKIISNENKTCMQELSNFRNILPLTIKGLHNILSTYKDDYIISKQIIDIINRYDQLLSQIINIDDVFTDIDKCQITILSRTSPI